MLDGRKLKYMRLLKGWSQPQLAEQVGVSESMVKLVENNYRIPSEATYKRWLDALYSDVKLEDKMNNRNKKVKNEVKNDK